MLKGSRRVINDAVSRVYLIHKALKLSATPVTSCCLAMDNPIVTQIDADQEPNPKPPVPGHKHVDNLQYSQPRSIFGKTLSEESDAPVGHVE